DQNAGQDRRTRVIASYLRQGSGVSGQACSKDLARFDNPQESLGPWENRFSMRHSATRPLRDRFTSSKLAAVFDDGVAVGRLEDVYLTGNSPCFFRNSIMY